MARTAAALVIGNEILSGKVQEANVLSLARELRALGVELRRVTVVPDEIELIAAEVNALRGRYDFLFTSGGVGPTHDDVTVEGVARALGRRVVRHPHIESLLRNWYGERCTEGHLRMADVVEGTELFDGSNPQWPTMVLGNVFILPGIPEIFRYKLEGLRERLRGSDPSFVLRSVYSSADEGALKPLIDRVVERFPSVSVGSYPRWQDPAYSVRVTFDGRDETDVSAAAKDFSASLPPEWLVREE